jgi:hypothetical protein
MKYFSISLGVLFFLIVFQIQAVASENYIRQINTIILFYEMLTTKESPSVADFFKFFSEHNEAELELILRKEFPLLNFKGKWFDNQQAKGYVNKIYNNPELYSSLFLQCIKSDEPKLFADKVTRQIEFPPKINKDFKTFTVITYGNKVVFEFSQDEPTIENIYLPNGKSIYTLIEKCIK